MNKHLSTDRRARAGWEPPAGSESQRGVVKEEVLQKYRRFQFVQTCQTYSVARVTGAHVKKDKRNYFYKLFLTSGVDHYLQLQLRVVVFFISRYKLRRPAAA